MTFSRLAFSLVLMAVLVGNNAVAIPRENDAGRKLQFLLRNWVATPLRRTETAAAGFEGKIFQRFIPSFEHPIQVGSITQFTFRKKKGIRYDHGAELKKIQDAMDPAMKWSTRRLGKSLVREATWLKANRFFRIYLTDRGDSIALSVAMVRAGFAESIGIEAEIIQRAVAGELPGKPKPLDQLISWLAPLAVEEAFAIDPPLAGADAGASDLASLLLGMNGGLGASGLPDGGTSGLPTGATGGIPGGALGMSVTTGFDPSSLDSINNLSSTLGGLSSQIPGLTNQWTNTNDQLTRFNSQVPGIMDAWNRTNEEVSSINNQLPGFQQEWRTSNAELHEANQVLSDISKEIPEFNKNMKDFNAQFKRANDIADKFSDPKHMAVLAAASAAGAVVGAMAVNLAIDGVVAGGRYLYELVTGEQKEKRLLEAFKTAIAKWDEQAEKLAKLEKAIDASLKLRNVATKLKLTPETALELSALIEVKEIERKIARENLETQVRRKDCSECIVKASKEAAELNDVVENLKLVQENFEKVNMDTSLCSDLLEAMRKVHMVEGLMQKLRLEILAAQDLWLKQYRKDIATMKENAERTREKQEQVAKLTKKAATDIRGIDKDEKEIAREIWMDNCTSRRRSAEFKKSWWRFMIPQTGNCEREYEANYATYKKEQKDLAEQRYANRVANAEAMLEFSKERIHGVRVNGATVDQELDGYLRWFKQLETEQACSNRDPGACPALQFESMTKRIEKRAENERKIEDICGKRLF